MSDFRSLSHSRWDCKYHLVFIVITIEFSRLGAGKLLYNNQLYFLWRQFLTLKGIKGCNSMFYVCSL